MHIYINHIYIHTYIHTYIGATSQIAPLSPLKTAPRLSIPTVMNEPPNSLSVGNGIGKIENMSVSEMMKIIDEQLGDIGIGV